MTDSPSTPETDVPADATPLPFAPDAGAVPTVDIAAEALSAAEAPDAAQVPAAPAAAESFADASSDGMAAAPVAGASVDADAVDPADAELALGAVPAVDAEPTGETASVTEGAVAESGPAEAREAAGAAEPQAAGTEPDAEAPVSDVEPVPADPALHVAADAAVETDAAEVQVEFASEGADLEPAAEATAEVAAEVEPAEVPVEGAPEGADVGSGAEAVAEPAELEPAEVPVEVATEGTDVGSGAEAVAEPVETAAEVEPAQVPVEVATEGADADSATAEPVETAADIVAEPVAAPEGADVEPSAEGVAEPAEVAVEVAPEHADVEPAAVAAGERAESAGPEAPRPSPLPGPPPGGAAPSPAMFAAKPKPPAAPAIPAQAHDVSASAAYGRVGEDGTVFVREGEGERAVGSYPGASDDEALQYFARKYDELYANAELLHQRVALAEVTSRDIADGLKALRAHIGEANVVGDLAALHGLVEQIDTELGTKRAEEAQVRAAAKAEALTAREEIVAEAERVAGQPVEKVQWKSASASMRSLLDTWKEQQRNGARLDKDIEAALWQRFSRARNAFDKARRSYFAELETTRSAAKSEKERLIREAESLAGSKDWSATAGAFKRLMDQWRRAGRASRTEDDALWERFKGAQDRFFAAKDEVVAAEEEEYRANLEVKLGLLKEAEALLPIKDLEATKSALRVIQDKWDAAGRVPRADVDRVEKGLRRVESAIRDADEHKWRRTNPEAASRAASLATQLEASVAKLEDELAKAEAKGDARKIREVTEKLAAQRAWLDQARGGLAEFGG